MISVASCGRDKVVHTVLKGISPKVNILAQLEFKLTCYNAAIQYVSHYGPGELQSAVVPSIGQMNSVKKLFIFNSSVCKKKRFF